VAALGRVFGGAISLSLGVALGIAHISPVIRIPFALAPAFIRGAPLDIFVFKTARPGFILVMMVRTVLALLLRAAGAFFSTSIFPRPR
jgi:hypothetical protein